MFIICLNYLVNETLKKSRNMRVYVQTTPSLPPHAPRFRLFMSRPIAYRQQIASSPGPEETYVFRDEQIQDHTQRPQEL